MSGVLIVVTSDPPSMVAINADTIQFIGELDNGKRSGIVFSDHIADLEVEDDTATLAKRFSKALDGSPPQSSDITAASKLAAQKRLDKAREDATGN